MDPATIESIVKAAVTASMAALTTSQTANNREVVEAAVTAAANLNSTQQQSLRKPTLPPFDPKNIDVWLKRMDAAFDRLKIVDPRLKFAHLDEKIPADKDPRINDYMWGAPTQARWEEFIAYLRKKHGRTTKQMAQSVIQGTSREGRCPSQLWSIMKDKAATVTLDDILKEQLLKEMPTSVQEHLQTKIKGKTGQEVADLADEYFDPDGKLLHSSNASGINSVRQSRSVAPTLPSALKQHQDSLPNGTSTASAPTSSFTSPFENDDVDADVHAVRFRQGQKQQFNVANRSASRGRSRYDSKHSNSRSGNSSGNDRSSSRQHKKQSDPTKCFYHNTFGEKAEKCDPSCSQWSKHQPKGQASR